MAVEAVKYNREDNDCDDGKYRNAADPHVSGRHLQEGVRLLLYLGWQAGA